MRTSLLIGAFVAYVAMLLDVAPITALGLGVCAYALDAYVASLGRDLAIVQLTLLITAMQCILGPFFAYYFDAEHWKYRMYVGEEEYMWFAVPAIIAFATGLRVFASRVDLAKYQQAIVEVLVGRNTFPYALLAIGAIATVLTPFVPSALAFVFFVLGQLQYVALVGLFAARHRHRWIITVAVLVLGFWSSAETGLFHSLIIWSALIFSFVNIDLKFGRLRKYLVIAVAVFVLVSIQNVKSNFRSLIWHQGYTGSRIVLLVDMLLDPSRYGVSRDFDGSRGYLNARLNQGWIISAIMAHVPAQRAFENGRTIGSAVIDSLVPRFFGEKRQVIQSEAFKRYTGLKVHRSTSFGIGILGEAWVNFGKHGVTFMFVWGLVLSGVIKLLIYFARFRPTLLLWTPLIFFQVVKAETELVIVLNHLVKAIIIVLLIRFGMRLVWGIKF